MSFVEIVCEVDDASLDVDKLESFASNIIEELGIDNWHMGLLLTDDEKIRSYNRQWRNIDKPTDVLSFVQGDGEQIPQVPGMPEEAGDVIISLETVVRNAREWESTYDEELRRVIIHGILHLKGMDHPGDDYESGMLKLQEELLSGSTSVLKTEK